MSELEQALAEATEEVLSTMFFTMVDTAAASEDGAACSGIKIEFRGRWSGALSLYSSPEATAEMAANFLGYDETDPPAANEQESVSKELANMICGAVLSRLRSTEVFELLSPEPFDSLSVEEPAPQPGTQIAEQVYGVGSGFLRLRFRLDGTA